MSTPHSVVNPLCTFQVARYLPVPGKVLVRVGDSVEHLHVVADALQMPDFRVLDVARLLDVPPDKIKPYLKVKAHDRVEEGAVLAARGSLGGLVCRSPIKAQVKGVGGGLVMLEADPEPIRLSALVPGIVVDAWPTQGVLLETVGAFIQAAWGNNREAYGVMRVVVRANRHPIRPKHIDASSQGAVLVGGSKLDEETLDAAVEMQVRGIIVGGVPASLIPRLQAVDFPVIATEGIGEISMSKAAFDLLRSLDGREAAVCGRLKLRWGAEHPYIAIPMPSGTAAPINPDTPLSVGSRVRVLRAPYVGQSGVVVDIPKGMMQLESGARLPVVQVEFSKSEQGYAPIANLELLL